MSTMTPANVTPTMTPCPEWCDSHYASDQPGDVGAHQRTFTFSTTPLGIEASAFFDHDGNETERSVWLDGLPYTPVEARAVAAALLQAAELLDS